ncbi:helix-turn-helix domain-containing protein [Schumannella luteola]
MDRFFRSSVEAPTATQAEHRLRQRYGDVELGGLGAYRERSAGDSRFVVSKVVLDGDFTIDADVRVVSVAFSTPGYRWRSGDEEGDLSTAPALFEPGKQMSSRFSGRTGVTTVTFQVASLAAFALGYYGHERPISFEGARPASASHGRVWAESVRTVIESNVLENDLTRVTAYEALAVVAMEAFRLGGERRERVLTPRGGLTAYRAATDFVADNVGIPVGESDIAVAAGVSVADLRIVYAAHSVAGWTPAQHLRASRLAAVHVDLLLGDPAHETVSAIGGRWGFTNPGKFAEAYRAVYGVSPRTVLAS